MARSVEDVEQIKRSLDYVSFYSGEGVRLQGDGAERTALCPFHDDRQTSLAVNVETGLWTCYAGCGGGDAFSFYQRAHSADFPAAKTALAELAGVKMTNRSGGQVVPIRREDRAAKPKPDEPPPIPDELVTEYHQALLDRPKALDFLRERKGISEATVRAYELGYDGERIVIPVRDASGAVRNLRRYHPDQKPKMLPYQKGYGAVRLWPLAALDADELVFCEGEWDCMLARQLGLNAITQTGGAGTWDPDDEWAPLFRAKTITVCYDHDEPGRKGAERVARELALVAAEVRIVELPLEGDGEDLSDWILRHGGTLDAWRELVAAAPVLDRRKPDKSELPRIDAGQGDLAAIAEQAWAAIEDRNNPPFLFQRGGLVTAIDQTDDGEPALTVVTEAGMRGVLARAAWWYRWAGRSDDKVMVDAHPPVAAVKDMMATPEHSLGGLPLPVITRLVEAPVFGRDGALETLPGYHAASRTYYWDSGLSFEGVRAQPTPADIEQAKALLLGDLLVDFPFTGPAEQAHALATLLCPFARELIPGPTPLHLIEAPTPGTGKSLLADAISMPATGRPSATMTEGRDEDEWRKRITAALIAAPTYLLIDNVRRKLDSAALSAVLTSQSWQDRILGRSELTKLPARSIWMATGNNPALTTEMARRTVRIRMDARLSHPWKRKGFRHADLRTWASAHRGDLVWAALTCVQAWVAAGRPPGNYVLGQYEAWAHVMGGILDVIGVEGFLANIDEVYSSADEETQQWEEFMDSWWELHGDRPQSVRELFRIASERDLLLLVRGSGSEQGQKIKVGRALGQMRDRQIGDWRIVQDGMARRNTALYRLVQVADGYDQSLEFGGGQKAVESETEVSDGEPF